MKKNKENLIDAMIDEIGGRDGMNPIISALGGLAFFAANVALILYYVEMISAFVTSNL